MLTSSCAGSLWEQWYEQAAPEQRRMALLQAGEQGLLFLQHLPAPEGTPPAGPRRPLQTAQQHGPAPDLAPFRSADIQPIDGDLDETQRQAVARALASPDLSLILGYPGSGKSRVIAEVLRQAVKAGWRVLFLAPGPAGLDRVLGRLVDDPCLGVLRCLAGDEDPATLPPRIQALTREQRRRTFTEQTLPQARAGVSASASALESLHRDEALWGCLDELVARHDRLNDDLAEVERGRLALDDLDAEPDRGGEGPFPAAGQDARPAAEEETNEIDARLARVRAEQESLCSQQKQRDAERQELVPLAEAKHGHRWWTGAFWRATLQGSRLQRLEQLQAESQKADERLGELQVEEQRCLAAREQRAAELRQQRAKRLVEERSRREADLEGRVQELTRRREEIDRTWQSLSGQFSAGAPRPAALSQEAVRRARADQVAKTAEAEQDLAARKQWLLALEEALPNLPEQLVSSARIVAATTAALPGDPDFGDRSAPVLFDLLVLDEAHRLSDGELLALSRRGARWLLVGEPAAELPPSSPPPRRNAPVRPRPVQPRPAFLRLWSQVHADPRRLPVRWRREDGRLVGALRPIAPEQESWVQDEPVFDRPEIQLRIVSAPRQEPQVAEVVFPASTPIEQAKEFIYRELQELSVQSFGPAFRWSECPSCVTLEMNAARGACVSAPLEAGVHELVAPRPRAALDAEGEAPFQTCALTFDRSSGWDREAAERWVAERLGLRDSGRTTVLARSYRAREPLARFLCELLYSGLGGAPGDSHVCKLLANLPGVEFAAVPAMSRSEGWRGGDLEPRWGGGGTATLSPRLRSVKGGAGLEIDLADARRTEALPADVRAHLPRQGIVNFAEARAVVGMLEAMAADAALTSAARQAQGVVGGPAVAVISLFPSQVDLLRLLIQRSPLLAGSPLDVEVGRPDAFHQREALVVLVSLTRSHAHRAVPFSDAPQGLLLALTRPIARLVLVGDPGTMVRRSQWHGGLDHLDELAGPLEQTLVSQLLAQLTQQDAPGVGRGREPSPAARSRESSGV
jgi:hypothetical protein